MPEAGLDSWRPFQSGRNQHRPKPDEISRGRLGGGAFECQAGEQAQRQDETGTGSTTVVTARAPGQKRHHVRDKQHCRLISGAQ